jgi:hypothetical protein
VRFGRFLAGFLLLCVAAAAVTSVAVVPLWFIARRTPSLYAVLLAIAAVLIALRSRLHSRSKGADHQER